jgi:DNA-binding NarL/FixJ family response regulator
VIRDDGDRTVRVRVLIAEDDPRVRTALRRFLSASDGFDVVGDAGNATTALEIARAVCPAVALVDVLLPEARDGLSLLRALTAELGIPAVAISIQGWVRGDALAAGAYRFLDKDSAPELLVAALRDATSGVRTEGE